MDAMTLRITSNITKWRTFKTTKVGVTFDLIVGFCMEVMTLKVTSMQYSLIS
jgi:hypothetical protein